MGVHNFCAERYECLYKRYYPEVLFGAHHFEVVIGCARFFFTLKRLDILEHILEGGGIIII